MSFEFNEIPHVLFLTDVNKLRSNKYTLNTAILLSTNTLIWENHWKSLLTTQKFGVS